MLAYPERRSADNYATIVMIVNGTVNERLEVDGGTRGEIPLKRVLAVEENMSKNSYRMECATLILQKARKESACLIAESEGG